VLVSKSICLVTYTLVNLMSALISSHKLLSWRVLKRRDVQAKCLLLFCTGFNDTVSLQFAWSQTLEWRKSNELKRIFKSSGKSASVGKSYPRFKGTKRPAFSTQRQHNTQQDTSIRQVHCEKLKSSNYEECNTKSYCIVSCTVPTLAGMDATRHKAAQ
jgi:hypothetical protein